MTAKEDEGSAAEQAELNKSVEAAAAKASAAREKAEEAAKGAGLEPPDLQELEDESMPRRGLARKANGTPTAKAQRNHRVAEGFAYTDPGSHLMKSDAHYIQVYNWQVAVDSEGQVIVAVGVSKQAPNVEHLAPML